MALNDGYTHDAASSLPPAAFAEMPYTCGVLLDARLDASITDHADFRRGCQGGFENYDFDIFLNDTDYDFSTPAGVCQFVSLNRFDAASWRLYNVGFVLGTLSALALTNRPLALLGLGCLQESVHSSRLLPRGW